MHGISLAKHKYKLALTQDREQLIFHTDVITLNF